MRDTAAYDAYRAALVEYRLEKDTPTLSPQARVAIQRVKQVMREVRAKMSPEFRRLSDIPGYYDYGDGDTANGCDICNDPACYRNAGDLSEPDPLDPDPKDEHPTERFYRLLEERAE